MSRDSRDDSPSTHASSTDEARLRTAYGFDVPEDLHRFWAFAKRAAPKRPLAVLSDLEIALTGPFAVLAGELDGYAGPLHPLLHFRFRNDPPELLTVALGSSDGLHWGYWFDERPDVATIASYYNHDAYEITDDGCSLFDAFRRHLESAWQGAKDDEDRAETKKLDRLRELLTAAAGDTRPETGDRFADRMRSVRSTRLARVVAASSEGMGIVAPAETYSPLAKATPWLHAELAEGDLEGHVAEARRALEAGFPATALKLGRELWSLRGSACEAAASELLVGAYRALGRPELAEIAGLHARHRNLPRVDITEYDEEALEKLARGELVAPDEAEDDELDEAGLADEADDAAEEIDEEADAADDEAVDADDADDDADHEDGDDDDAVVYVVDDEGGSRVVRRLRREPRPKGTPDDGLVSRIERWIDALPDAAIAARIASGELASRPAWRSVARIACWKLVEARDFDGLHALATQLAEANEDPAELLFAACVVIAKRALGQPGEAELDALAKAAMPNDDMDEATRERLDESRERIVDELVERAERDAVLGSVAVELAGRLHALAPSLEWKHLFLHRKGLALAALKDRDGAATCFREAVRLRADWASGFHWLGHVTTGEESRAAYEKARRLYEESDDDDEVYQLASTCAVLGDTKAAVRLLKRAFEDDPDLREHARSDPELDALRGLPQFQKLLA